LLPIRSPGTIKNRGCKSDCFDVREIREYFIPDFSNWKNHDSYQEAFQRLLSDLKASDPNQK
jgi:hypothetical protein